MGCYSWCMWVNSVHLHISQTKTCPLHHDSRPHCSTSLIEPTQIIGICINAVVGACEWTSVHPRTSQTKTCLLHHDSWLHCSASLIESKKIIGICINAVVSACEWIVCTCAHHIQKSLSLASWILTTFLYIAHRAQADYWHPH